jgi:hypothetical protein
MMKHKKGDKLRILENDNTRGKGIAGGIAVIEYLNERDNQYGVIYHGFGGPAGPYHLTDDDLGPIEEAE